MYILCCSDGGYYTGSTKNLEARLYQHQIGDGANYTKKRLPVELVYFEEYERFDEAFYREKQVQRWTRKKKEALINNNYEKLKRAAVCVNNSHCRYAPLDSARGTALDSARGTALDSARGTALDSARGA